MLVYWRVSLRHPSHVGSFLLFWSQALHLLHDGQSKRLPPNVIANNAAVSACEKVASEQLPSLKLT